MKLSRKGKKPEAFAAECFTSGFSCSQALLTAFCGDFGMDEKSALALAGPFGAGMGRLGEVCGALTGAFMVMGLKYPRLEAKDESARENAFNGVRSLADAFFKEFGHLRCRDLLGLDLSIPESRARAKELNHFTDRCLPYVRFTASWLECFLSY